MKKQTILLGISMLMILLASSVNASISKQLPIQGRLTDNNSKPINTPVTITFEIFDSETGGTSLWSETHHDVDVSNGLFSVVLGKDSNNPLNLKFNKDYYVQITIGEGVATETLYPRQKLLPAPYSLYAEEANQAVVANSLSGQITANNIAANAVTSDKILDATITEQDLGNNIITTDKLADKAVTSNKIADATITIVKLAADVMNVLNPLMQGNLSLTGNIESSSGSFSNKVKIAEKLVLGLEKPTITSIAEIKGTGLSPTTTYCYKVTAVAGEKESLGSDKACATTGSESSLAINMTWDPVTFANQYYIYRKDDDGNYKKIGNTRETNFTDNGKPLGTETPPTGVSTAGAIETAGPVSVGSLNVLESAKVRGDTELHNIKMGYGTYTSERWPYEYITLESSDDVFAGLMHSQTGSYGENSFTIYTYNDRNIILQPFSGNVGINRNPDSEYKLDVKGKVRASKSVTASKFVSSSDKRLKENIKTLNNALEKTEKLRGVSYNWKDSGEKDIGLIAQEVEKVFPELVTTDEDGYKQLDYDKVSAVLIEAVKELKAKNNALEQRIAALEQKCQ